MSIIKVEEYKYHIVYYEDDKIYSVYKRIDTNSWEILHENKWKKVPSKEAEKREEEFKNYKK
jgi:hypothetical protein